MEDLAVFTAINYSRSRPRSQFFTIRTSQPANNIYMFQATAKVVVISTSDDKAWSLQNGQYA